jgi:hypothetical protein
MTTSPREDKIPDIERTREQLGDTVEALAHKVDVPARVKETVQVKTEEVKQQAQAKAEEVQAAGSADQRCWGDRCGCPLYPRLDAGHRSGRRAGGHRPAPQPAGGTRCRGGSRNCLTQAGR